MAAVLPNIELTVSDKKLIQLALLGKEAAGSFSIMKPAAIEQITSESDEKLFEKFAPLSPFRKNNPKTT